MASGVIRTVPPVYELVSISGSNTTGDGTYVIPTSLITHFSQIHIHQHGNMIEMNIVVTLKGPMTVGTFYTWATTPLKPMYTLRAEGYGAQGTSDYAVQEGIVSLNTAGNLNFTPYSAVASGGQRTFRFNLCYMLSTDVYIGGGGVSNNAGSTITVSSVIEALYPVGSVYISMNSTMPSAIADVGTWQAITGDYVLKTITTGAGGTYSNAGNTGSTTLTVNQIPSHTHSITNGTMSWPKDGTAAEHGPNNWGTVVWPKVVGVWATDARGGGQGHDHTAGMPKNVSIYMWKRTA